MTPDERWLAAVWRFVRAGLPAPPARVLEIGCGPLGGFVPMLRASGYDATGVDPQAPEGAGYCQAEFERYDVPQRADALVACTSLHHVADVGDALDRAEAALIPGGAVVIVEWAREWFDEATARWCFERLPPPADEPGWLREHRARWQASGLAWDDFFASWAHEEGLHAGQDIVRELQARFGCQELSFGPYYFPDLAGTSEADEQAAIDAGQIRANRIQYRGKRA